MLSTYEANTAHSHVDALASMKREHPTAARVELISQYDFSGIGVITYTFRITPRRVVEVASDARKPVFKGGYPTRYQPKCGECMTALSIIDYDEASDHANTERDEVQEAYQHLESHS